MYLWRLLLWEKEGRFPRSRNAEPCEYCAIKCSVQNTACLGSGWLWSSGRIPSAPRFRSGAVQGEMRQLPGKIRYSMGTGVLSCKCGGLGNSALRWVRCDPGVLPEVLGVLFSPSHYLSGLLMNESLLSRRKIETLLEQVGEWN